MRTTTPKRNREFWVSKFAANAQRDAKARTELESSGFGVLVLWECETEDRRELERRLRSFFGQSRGKRES